MNTPTRFPCEIIEDEGIVQVIDYHPETDVPWSTRIIEKNTKFGPRWAWLDFLSRDVSNAMQGEIV